MIKPRLGLIKISRPPFNNFFCIGFKRGIWIARASGRNQVIDWRMVSVLHQDQEASYFTAKIGNNAQIMYLRDGVCDPLSVDL